MAGYDQSRPPDVEVYVEDGDGSPMPHTDRSDGRPPTGPPTDPAVTTIRLVDAVGSAISGACGRRAIAPRLEGSQPLVDTATMHVITGGDPAPVDLGAGTVGSALFVPDTGQVVTDIALGRDATVLLVAPSAGGGPGRVVRVPTGGEATDIPLPDRTRRVMLIAGGDRVWISASPGSYGFAPVTLLAADGSGDTVTLPGGLEPLGGTGRLVVGQYSIDGIPSGPFDIPGLVSSPPLAVAPQPAR